MGTKLEPGAFDAYAKAEPDEPYFMLLARDITTPDEIRSWIQRQQSLDRMGFKPLDAAQIAEAYAVITECEIWYREHRVKQQMATLEFDSDGNPTTGEHRRRERNSTSGAND